MESTLGAPSEEYLGYTSGIVLREHFLENTQEPLKGGHSGSTGGKVFREHQQEFWSIIWSILRVYCWEVLEALSETYLGRTIGRVVGEYVQNE